jgi:hypothetical protein
MTDRPRTSFDLTRDEMRLLRSLAADLGSLVRRGPGAGELGNITDLLRRLTVAYERDPTATAATLRALVPPDDAPVHPLER